MIGAVDWNDTPDSDRVPTDAYHLTVEETEQEYTQNGTVVFHATLRIDGPELYKNTVQHVRFYVGTKDDPDADQPDTWKKFGAQQLKKYLVAIFGLEQLSGDPYADFMASKGYPVGSIVETKPDTRKTIKGEGGQQEENPYYGFEQTRFTKWFNVADPAAPPAGSLSQGAGAGPVRMAPGRPPARPAGPPPRPVAAAPAAPAAPVAAAPAAAAPPAAPPARVAPARPAPPARPAAPPARPAPPPPRA